MPYIVDDDSKRFEEAVIELIPAVRAFAKTLSRSRADVDDLVQETLARAWRYKASFRPETNLRSWLYKILQNCFNAAARRDRQLVDDPDGFWAAKQATPAAQEWSLQYGEVLTAMQNLPSDSRHALSLVVDEGRTYQEAADIAHCPLSTFKSRLKRARDRLTEGHSC